MSSHDERQLQRYLDGALDPAAAAAFAARLQGDDALRQRHDEAVAMRGLFTAAAAATPRRPRADFTAGVLAAARQLPTRQQLQQADEVGAAMAFCRRLLFAAALLGALGLLWRSGLATIGATIGHGADTLQAAPDDVRQEIDRLDALLHSGSVDAPPAAGSPSAGSNLRR
jgi:anti-sigma factor RsiW